MFYDATPSILTLKIQGRFIQDQKTVNVICDERNNPPDVLEGGVLTTYVHGPEPSQENFAALQSRVYSSLASFLQSPTFKEIIMMEMTKEQMQSEGEVSTRMAFGGALACLRLGNYVRRAGWNGKGLWLAMQVPDKHSKMTLPYIYINYPADAANTPGARVPWVPSQTDVLAEDWVVVEAWETV